MWDLQYESHLGRNVADRYSRSTSPHVHCSLSSFLPRPWRSIPSYSIFTQCAYVSVCGILVCVTAVLLISSYKPAAVHSVYRMKWWCVRWKPIGRYQIKSLIKVFKKKFWQEASPLWFNSTADGSKNNHLSLAAGAVARACQEVTLPKVAVQVFTSL